MLLIILLNPPPPPRRTLGNPVYTEVEQTSRNMASTQIEVILGKPLYILYIVIYLSYSWHYKIQCEGMTPFGK